MLNFTGGFVAGCCMGVMSCLLFLLFANAIPDGFPRSKTKDVLPAWQFSAVIMVVMLISTFVYKSLNPHRLAFLALVLLLLVLVTAKERGMLASLATLAFATVIMSYILPPANTIWIATAKDRVLLAVFICFGVVGSRLVGRRLESL